MVLSTLVLQLVLGFFLSAQEARVSITPRAPARSADRVIANIRVDSDLVLVPVLVTDRWDQLITGLAKNNFQVFEDNVEQTISHFTAEDVPVSVGLVFDISGSMKDKIDRSRAAADEFIRVSNPEDEFMLITFNSQVELLQPFTSEFGDIQNRLPFLEPGGRTALLDAVCLALGQMKHARHARKAIIIISDGGDNCSRYTEREVRNRVREADVQIYSIGILEAPGAPWRTPEEAGGARLLKLISGPTGGRFLEVYNPDDLPATMARIGRELRNQYVLGYSPSMRKRDGKYHKIFVRLMPPPVSGALRTIFRSCYFAPLP